MYILKIKSFRLLDQKCNYTISSGFDYKIKIILFEVANKVNECLKGTEEWKLLKCTFLQKFRESNVSTKEVIMY